jgi:two-component system KDP operon response regulator KdpE
MSEEDTSFVTREVLACLERIERLLVTLVETMRDDLQISRQLLVSSAATSEEDEAEVPQLTGSDSEALTFRELTINPVEHVVTLGDQPIELTPTEFDILFCLLSNAGQVLSCQELVRQAQGYDLDERDARYLIRPHITRLRQKLVAEPGSPEYIHNVRGIGYFFERRAKHRD